MTRIQRGWAVAAVLAGALFACTIALFLGGTMPLAPAAALAREVEPCCGILGDGVRDGDQRVAEQGTFGLGVGHAATIALTQWPSESRPRHRHPAAAGAGAPLPPGRSRLYGNGLLQGVAYHPHS